MRTRLFIPLTIILLAACAQTGPPSPAPLSTAIVPPDPSLPPPAAIVSDPVTSAAPSPPATTAAEATDVSAPTPALDPGALIAVSLESRVGVLLDEFPAEMRDRVAAALIAEDQATWVARAVRQVQLTRLRLNFRDYAYDDKGQLPLPPVSQWTMTLDPGGPSREVVQGHDVVVVDYRFETTILTDSESPGQSEPALASADGVWLEPFVFPVDPFLVLQRTGNACVNEAGFPPQSFDSENVWQFYDYTCAADSGGPLGCHRTSLPAFSCREALAARVGEVEASVRFERLPWDAALADRVRLDDRPVTTTPDLAVVTADLATHRVVYRYIDPTDCALEEGAVGGAGWRRLLLFDATVHNVGRAPLHIGPVVREDPETNVFEYSSCHDHFHYSHYGEFYLADSDDVQSSKRAFCVQSTSRYANDETSPLTHDYSCTFQGIQAGWVDEYIAGLDTQWIDISDLDVGPEGRTVQLGFRSNGDGFLCEGLPILGEDGAPLWEVTSLTTDDGKPISRPRCTLPDDWDANNVGEIDVLLPPAGSFVTEPCQSGESGPARNCGFAGLALPLAGEGCVQGETVELTLSVAAPGEPQVVRVCETSSALGGLACGREAAVANGVVGAELTTFVFACPAIRDGRAGEGGFALFSAPVWPADGPAAVVQVGAP